MGHFTVASLAHICSRRSFISRFDPKVARVFMCPRAGVHRQSPREVREREVQRGGRGIEREVRIPRTARRVKIRETPNEIEKKMLNGAMLKP